MLKVVLVACFLSLLNGEKYGTVIGIDLGTTYSVVAVYQNKNVHVIPNSQGNRITPSYVSYEPDGTTLVGDAAKNQLSIRPESTLYELKRLLGRESSDESFKVDIPTWPFKVHLDQSKPMVGVKVGEKEKIISPVMGSAMVLMEMKRIAELQLNQTINHAVITVPAYFNDAQRQATKDAGAIAGLNVLRVINEPTAAALAFGMDKQMSDSRIIVFDLGGGTFDVSVLTIDNGVFEVMATCGDTHLGGQDFDRIVTNNIIKRAADEGLDIGKEQKTIQKIREAAERAKRDLSSKLETFVSFEHNGIRKSFKLTRVEFERLIDEDLKKLIPHVERCLKDAGIKKTEVDHILMVGGSTRIPKVHSLVTNFFNKKPSLGVNPDEAVAAGAAIQGSILSGANEVEDIVLLDVTPLTLGIETVGGVMTPVISRGSSIPNKKSQVFSTAADNQESVQIRVFEGERGMVEGNRLLNQFTLTGIRPAPRGVPQIEVTFEVDANSILTVSAEDKETKQRNQVIVNQERSKLSQEEVEKMVAEAEKYKAQDEKSRKDIEARNELEVKVYQLKKTIDDKEKKTFDESTSSKLNSIVDEYVSWLDSNKKPDSEVSKAKILEFEEKVKNITGGQQQQNSSEEEL